VDAVKSALAEDTGRGHEGIAYLLGRTDGETTLAVAAFKPLAHTTPGSFEVGTLAMAKVVRAAADLSLQMVGQVHSHPGSAHHSDGDVTGARSRYAGYVSIVLPSYGRRLPALTGAAVYMYAPAAGFVEVDATALRVIPAGLP
jgi:proteasome lid subunit RPN8/RPN11